MNNYSPFNPVNQFENIDNRIIVALDRISEAFKVLLLKESKELSLSPIQLQILIFLKFHNKELCTVSYISNEFNVTKPTVSDSIKVLLDKKLVEKQINTNDSRSFYLILTDKGQEITNKVLYFTSSLSEILLGMPYNDKKLLFENLLIIIEGLVKKNIVNVQRMCFNCKNYQKKGEKHFCNLLNKFIENEDIRIDCPEHKEI